MAAGSPLHHLSNAGVICNRSPLLPRHPLRVFSRTASARLYGAYKPGTDSAKYIKIKGADLSTTTTLSSAKVAKLLDAHVDGGTLNAADYLRVIVVKNGVLQTRVAASATPSGAQFKTSGAGPIIVTLGTAAANGDIFEMYVLDSGDVIEPGGGALTQYRPYDVVCPDFLYSANDFDLEALARGA